MEGMSMNRVLATLIVGALVSQIFSCPVEATQRVQLGGRITNEAGAPIEGAKVLVQVVAFYTTGPSPESGEVWQGVGNVLTSNPYGRYRTVLPVPSDIPAKNLYVKITAAKLDGPPILKAGGQMVPLAVGSQILHRSLRVSDIVLKSTKHGFGVFITGSVRDAETGERLPGTYNIVLASDKESFEDTHFWARTNAEGEFFGVLPLTAATAQLITYEIFPQNNGVTYLYGQPRVANPPSGLTYLDGKYPTLPVESGHTYTLNFELLHSSQQTAIVGQLIDGVTGQPIPHALVVQTDECSTCFKGGPGRGYQTVVTDEFGNYRIAFDASVSPFNVQVSTNGSLLSSTEDNLSSYERQTINITRPPRTGEIATQGITLYPRD